MQDPTKTTPDLFTPIEIGPLKLPNRSIPLIARRSMVARIKAIPTIRY